MEDQKEVASPFDMLDRLSARKICKFILRMGCCDAAKWLVCTKRVFRDSCMELVKTELNPALNRVGGSYLVYGYESVDQEYIDARGVDCMCGCWPVDGEYIDVWVNDCMHVPCSSVELIVSVSLVVPIRNGLNSPSEYSKLFTSKYYNFHDSSYDVGEEISPDEYDFSIWRALSMHRKIREICEYLSPIVGYRYPFTDEDVKADPRGYLREMKLRVHVEYNRDGDFDDIGDYNDYFFGLVSGHDLAFAGDDEDYFS